MGVAGHGRDVVAASQDADAVRRAWVRRRAPAYPKTCHATLTATVAVAVR
jgi:hypothetical protein